MRVIIRSYAKKRYNSVLIPGWSNKMSYRAMAALLSSFVGASVAGAAGDVTNQRILEEADSGENWFLKGGNFRGEILSASQPPGK